MPTMDLGPLILLLIGLVLGGAGVWIFFWKLRAPAREFEKRIVTQTIAEHVRAVGKLVGLEVSAKEIATATSGWPWLPPILLSQARLAMIFQFEKQYSVDLSRLRPSDVQEVAPGRFRVVLPPIEGVLRLTDVFPYDIQSGRVMGLLDVIPMHADRQKDLMKRAQAQAAELFVKSDARYMSEARASIERHVRSLLAMFGVEVEIAWSDEPAAGGTGVGAEAGMGMGGMGGVGGTAVVVRPAQAATA